MGEAVFAFVIVGVVGIAMAFAIVADANSNKDDKGSQSEQLPTTKAPEVEHHPIYKALDVLLDAESNDVSTQIVKYIRNKIVAGCEEIQNSSKNQMLCGVRIKEYIGTSRTMFQENTALRALSGMSEEAFAKLVDGVCVDIYTQYFGE